MTASLWALLNNPPNWPGDDGDNEVTPHQAEDQGAGEEEVEDGDPHPANDDDDNNDDDRDDHDGDWDDDDGNDKSFLLIMVALKDEALPTHHQREAKKSHFTAWKVWFHPVF